ncbi:MAG: DUF4235 domain-containing protein [Cellulomonadaceae bacterium]|jgi:hypothetical protein|nr:DUF4235 domain-containing protein [Cellulomonadaceae bacterium]
MSHDTLDHDTDDAVLNKVIAAASGVAATFVANAVIRQVWKAATGESAPKNANDPGLRIAQAVAFAALSAGVAVLARRLATHGAASALQHVGRKSAADMAAHLVSEVKKGH